MERPNVIGWFDLYVDDMDRAVAFYESVFEQPLEAIDDPTGAARMMGFPANMNTYGASGALVASAHARPGPGGTMVYFSVDDCTLREARVLAARGQVVRPRFSIGAVGYVSLCIDSEGSPFGLNAMR